MALSDCVKCWETPCICGHEFPKWVQRLDFGTLLWLNELVEKRIKELKNDNHRNDS